MIYLTVARAKERMNAHIPYRILINGEEKAHLKPGEQATIEVNAKDKMRIIMTWSGSKEFELSEGFQSIHVFARGNVAYNLIGSAGAALFFLMVLVANHFAQAVVIKYSEAIFAMVLMVVLLYMLTKGKWSWIKLKIDMQ